MMELRNQIEEEREMALRNAIEEKDKYPENFEITRAELLKNVIAIIPELSKIGKTQSGGSIYEEQHPERSEIAILETSESTLEPVRLPDGSIIFREASEGSVQKVEKEKTNRNDPPERTRKHGLKTDSSERPS